VTHTQLTRHTRNGAASVLSAARLRRLIGGQPALRAVIAACASVAFFLRAYQLTRPGYLFGVTEYDDGVLFGNALRLVAGVIPYRDFSMVQPPGGMLLMAPAALLAKVAGTARGLAAARMLTVGADTANVVLLGLLARHRGPIAAGIACGLYAVYPDAIVAAHTFLLEPWLNLFCLAGAVAIFDRDRLAGAVLRPRPSAQRPTVAPRAPATRHAVPTRHATPTRHAAPTRHATAAPGAPRWSDRTRLLGGGLLFGFAVAIKIWALLPLAIAALLLLVAVRRIRPAATLAAGAAIGLGIPLLPFALLAPTALARGVLIGQLVRNASGSRHLPQRVADLAGLGLHPLWPHERLLLVAIVAALIGCCAAAYLPRGRPLGRGRHPGRMLPGGRPLGFGPSDGPSARDARRPDGRGLDAYALACAVAVTTMLLWPRLYYTHYGAFDAPFLALASALPVSRLTTPSRPTHPARPTMLQATVAAATVLLIIGLGYRQFRAEAPLRGVQVSAAADRLIPAGACVVSNGAAFVVAADRFYSDVPGCPAVVDPLGTMIAMTSGRYLDDTPAQLRPVVALWQTALDRAQYVWLTSGTFQEIPWNRSLNGYFTRHFRLIGLAGHPTGHRYVPAAGLYART
jgi:alpha-1,2-mannosyltransferase